MTQGDFAEALRQRVGDAGESGFNPEKILAGIEDLAQTMREADD